MNNNNNELPRHITSGNAKHEDNATRQASGLDTPNNANAPDPTTETPQPTLPDPTPTSARPTNFHPTVLTVDYEGGQTSIRPTGLVHEHVRNNITVEIVIYERFTAIIEEERRGVRKEELLGACATLMIGVFLLLYVFG